MALSASPLLFKIQIGLFAVHGLLLPVLGRKHQAKPEIGWGRNRYLLSSLSIRKHKTPTDIVCVSRSARLPKSATWARDVLCLAFLLLEEYLTLLEKVEGSGDVWKTSAFSAFPKLMIVGGMCVLCSPLSISSVYI
jgi:hypothetical protein